MPQPAFHVNGVGVSVLTPLLGAGVAIADRFDPRTFFDVIERGRHARLSRPPG